MPALTTRPPPAAPPPAAAVRTLPTAAQLAAGTTVQLRRNGALSEPLTLADAARHRRIALSSLEAVWEALWRLGAPTAGVLSRVPAAAVAELSATSVAQVNRAIPLLREFGLIRRRGRRRGAWDTTIPALVAHAAADNDALDALWQATPAPGQRLDRAVPASARRVAADVGDVDPAARVPPPALACTELPVCDLAAVTELVVLAVGPQARNQSWQGDIAAALRAGWSPRALAAELTRDLRRVRNVAAVCRDRLMVVIGRVPEAHRHCCGDWVEPQPAPGHGDRRPAPWHTHPPRSAPAATAVDVTAAGEAAVEAFEPVVASQVALNRAHTRSTSRKDPVTTTPSPPVPSRFGGEPPTRQPTTVSKEAETLSSSIIAEAIEVADVRLRSEDRARAITVLADELDRDPRPLGDLELRLDAVLGLVAGTGSARSASKVVMWRLDNPDERGVVVAKYRAAAAKVGVGGLSEPCAAAVMAAHGDRVAAAAAERAAADRAREAEQLARIDRRQREDAEAEQARQAERAATVRSAGAALRSRSEAVLGRPLHPQVAAVAERLVDTPAGAAATVLRRFARSAELAEDLAVLAQAAGLVAELSAMPVMVLPQGPLRRALARFRQMPGPLSEAVRRAQMPPTSPPSRSEAAELDPRDIDAALTEAAANPGLDAVSRRAWGEWLIAARTLRR